MSARLPRPARKWRLWLACALPGLWLSFNAPACTMNEVYIVNLSQDAIDIRDGLTCVSLRNDSAIEACIADEIRSALPPDCDRDFDIFVPGTNAEHGAWKQFNYLFRTHTNRAKLSLRYQDVREVEGLLGKLDPGLYDVGVSDAERSLGNLLRALGRHFNTGEVRVFGHSKGSHSVALAAPDFPSVDFYAFAQPGRTDRDIQLLNVLPPFDTLEAGKLGKPGYIEKLSPNLVGITFLNDEVQWFRGQDGPAPALVPERWDHPGWVWQAGLGGNPSGSYRIDHHNNYGGDYTDGGNGPDDWRQGEGSVGNNLPYCATGSQAAWSEGECDKQPVRQLPYFWGTPECEAEAYRMMARGNVGDDYYIGYSGPRAPGSCRQASHIISADYEFRIRWNLPDRNCRYDVEVAFHDLDSGRQISTFEYAGTTDNDETWFVRTGSVLVPIHMSLRLKGELVFRGGGGITPNCDSAFESEAYINYLKLSFTHPATGQVLNRTIIGLDEGVGNVTRLDGDNNVAWEQPSRNSDELYLYYSTLGFGSLKIEGPTEAGNEGSFRKRVHLVE